VPGETRRDRMFFRYYRQCKAMAFVHMPFLPRRLFSRPGAA
jgi:hypothetical protein